MTASDMLNMIQLKAGRNAKGADLASGLRPFELVRPIGILVNMERLERKTIDK